MQVVRILLKDDCNDSVVRELAESLKWGEQNAVQSDPEYLLIEWFINCGSAKCNVHYVYDYITDVQYFDIIGDDVTMGVIEITSHFPVRSPTDAEQEISVTETDGTAVKKLALAAIAAQIKPLKLHSKCFQTGLEHPDPWIRRAAAFAVGYSGQIAFADLLRNALKVETDEEVRAFASDSLASLEQI